MGRKVHLAGEVSYLGCMPNCRGSWGRLNGPHWGLIVEILTSLGKEVLDDFGSTGDGIFKAFGLYLKLNSDGDFET